jgi:hypothetical protein
MLEVLPGGTFTGLRTQPDLCLSVTQPLSSSPIHKNHVCVFLASHFFFVRKLKGKISSFLEEPIPVIKTVRIETHSSLFGGTFFLQPDRPCYFSEPQQEKQKTKIRHTEPRRCDGHQRLWLFLLPVGRPRSLLEGACLQSHV